MTMDNTDSRLARLYAVQRTPRDRWALTLLAAVVGLGLATVHWAGLLAGGALVGLAWPTLRRALLAGLGFAALALVVTATGFLLAGVFEKSLAMGQITYLAVAIPLVAGPLGASARGLLPDAPVDAGEQ
jgi:hypothetical protein